MSIAYLVIAFCAGIALATQAAINSQLSNSLVGQPVVAAFISFATGAITLFFITWWKTDLFEVWHQLPKQSWWKLIGGPLGALVVFTTVFLAPKVGVTNMLFFIIIGQLLTAMVIDHFGLLGMAERPVQIWQFIGMLVIFSGLALFFFGKKWFG
ncbi:transporter family-2 protein [Cricetibacter osteomyelitidis]|uniref:Transporter family-2 protein n=1 Tax=Cricetibacter osteomyelitidis TaxID=1521931 RepID=A0A4R2SY70_9PAST|nr:DMT family transporter [Cricetibacter osteomyelitidis]TCP93434.1 transporter family-2 protein [Cricetibacter osteomyelitidis]